MDDICYLVEKPAGCPVLHQMDVSTAELAHSMIFVLQKSSCSWDLNQTHNISSGRTIMTKLAVSALEEQWANLEQLLSENIQFWAGADIQAGFWFSIIVY